MIFNTVYNKLTNYDRVSEDKRDDICQSIENALVVSYVLLRKWHSHKGN